MRSRKIDICATFEGCAEKVAQGAQIAPMQRAQPPIPPLGGVGVAQTVQPCRGVARFKGCANDRTHPLSERGKK
jgi:hypothetical protein